VSRIDQVVQLLQDEASELRSRLKGIEDQLQRFVGMSDGTSAARSASKRSPAQRSTARRAMTKRSTAARRRPRAGNREKILAALKNSPNATSGEIAKATGIARATVASTMSKMRAEGKIPRPAARAKKS